MPTKKWTEEEEEFLKNNYMEMPNTELAEKFSITKNAVQKKLARMELKRTKAEKKEPSEDAPKADIVEEEKPETIDAESHFFLANNLYYNDRNYQEAAEEYKRAAKEESDELISLKARYWMAESYVKIEKPKEAMKIFKAIAAKHKNHYLGNSARRRVEVLTDYIATIM